MVDWCVRDSPGRSGSELLFLTVNNVPSAPIGERDRECCQDIPTAVVHTQTHTSSSLSEQNLVSPCCMFLVCFYFLLLFKSPSPPVHNPNEMMKGPMESLQTLDMFTLTSIEI